MGDQRGGFRWLTRVGTLFARLFSREATYYHCKDMHQAVKKQEAWRKERAEVLWAMKEPEDRGDYDTNRQNEIQTRDLFRSNLCAIHLKSPTNSWQKRWNVWNKLGKYQVQ